MFDETNQTQEVDMPESIFEESIEESPAAEEPQGQDSAKPAEEGAGALDAEQEQGEKEQTLRIKYNGEERDIPISEAITLAQKGMNYDHVLAERDTKYRREIGILDRYAKQSGMTREEYVRYLESSEAALAEDMEFQKLKNTYPDADDTLLRNLAQREIKLKKEEDFAQEKRKRQEEDEAKRKPWNAFFKEFPDVRPESLPQDFFDDVSKGDTPIEAFLKRRVKELEEKVTIAEKNRENAEKSPGSARGDAAKKEVDSFLLGFNDTSY